MQKFGTPKFQFASAGAESQQKRNRLFYRAALVLAVVNLAAQLFLWLPLHFQPAHMEADYQIYYNALRQLHDGINVYPAWPNYGPNLKPMHFLYPPTFLSFFYPLGWLSELWFARLLYGLIFLSFWIFAWCLARLCCQRANWDKVLLFGLLLGFWPGVIFSMSLGNLQIMLTALWGVAFAFSGRPIALSAAACIKIHPIWPLTVSLFDCVKQKGWPAAWKSVGVPSVLFFAAIFFLSVLLCGRDSFVLWKQNVLPLVSQGTFDSANISLPMGVLRVLRAVNLWHYESGTLPSGPRFFLTISTLCGPLAAWWLARRWPADLRQAFVGSAVVLFAPLCWLDYSAMFLVPFCLWLRYKGKKASETANEM